MKQLLFFPIALLALLACSSEEESAYQDNDLRQPIALNITMQGDVEGVSSPQTRAVSPTTSTRVYVSKTAGAASPVTYSYSGSAWTCASPLHWAGNDAINIYAYTNSNNASSLTFTTSGVTQTATTPYFLAVKQSAEYDSDFGGINLTLKQKLAKITVNITNGLAARLSGGVLMGLKPTGTYQPDAADDTNSSINSWTISGSTTDITMYKNGLALTAWVIPQSASSVKVRITYCNRFYTYTIASSAKCFKAGYNYIYNLTPKVINVEDLRYGDIIYDDCTIVHLGGTKPSGSTPHPVGVVVYKASSAETVCETGVTNEEGVAVVGKALVMCLQDAGGAGAYWQWSSTGNVDHDETLFPTQAGAAPPIVASTDYRGYAKTLQLANSSGECVFHVHPAANAAYYYGDSFPSTYDDSYLTGSTGWFLPSGGQWMQIYSSVCQNGNASGSNKVTPIEPANMVDVSSSWQDTRNNCAQNLNSLIENAGGTALIDDPNTSSQNQTYVSSSERDGGCALYFMWNATETNKGFRIGGHGQMDAIRFHVRAILAY